MSGTELWLPYAMSGTETGRWYQVAENTVAVSEARGHRVATLITPEVSAAQVTLPASHVTLPASRCHVTAISVARYRLHAWKLTRDTTHMCYTLSRSCTHTHMGTYSAWYESTSGAIRWTGWSWRMRAGEEEEGEEG
eukprot:2906720-Rhodomonas_salina.1